jgi:hypothetical protein
MGTFETSQPDTRSLIPSFALPRSPLIVDRSSLAGILTIASINFAHGRYLSRFLIIDEGILTLKTSTNKSERKMLQSSSRAALPNASHFNWSTRLWNMLKLFWKFSNFYGDYQSLPPSKRRKFVQDFNSVHSSTSPQIEK